MLSKHISIDDEYLKKIELYRKRHNGNFGAAIKDILKEIDLNSISIDKNLLNWLLKEIEDKLIPEDVLDKLVDPILINSVRKLDEHINNLFRKWDIRLIMRYDEIYDETLPSDIFVELQGPSQQIKFVGCLISQFFARCKNSLCIISYAYFNEFIKIEFQKSSRENAYKNLKTYFGGMDDVLNTIKNNPKFWKFLIDLYVLNNYNMILMHRKYFEDFLAGEIPSGELIIETTEKKPVREIPLEELLHLIKTNYEASRIIERAEIEGDNIILLHNYRNEIAKEKIKKFFINLLMQAGYIYNAKMATNLIILDHSDS